MRNLPRRGELWWCDMPNIGLRPVVVLSRERAIPVMRRAMVAPCTTTIRGLRSEVLLEPREDPVPEPTAVNLDSVNLVSVDLFLNRMGTLSWARMAEVCAAAEVALGCEA